MYQIHNKRAKLAGDHSPSAGVARMIAGPDGSAAQLLESAMPRLRKPNKGIVDRSEYG